MDIRRSVLWIIFSMSLLLLWDSWLRYTGKPSMFGVQSTQQADAAKKTGGPADVPTALQPAPTVPGGGEGQQAAKSERITITTDVIKADIDTLGGQIKRLELLKHKDDADPTKNVVLFDSSEQRTYLGQTGLTGGPFPNHKTQFTARPGVRSLDGSNQIELVLDSEQNGVKLTKTYVFKRGNYVVDINHAVTNTGSTPVAPSLYMQLVRDSSKLPSESKFYSNFTASTFTGPAVYTDAERFQKIDFSKIEDGKAEYAKKAENGWIAMVQHYFVSAFIPPENTPREIKATPLGNHLYAISTVMPVGTIAPGATTQINSRLFSGPQEEKVLEQVTPGLELVKDYGMLTIIAKPIFWLMEQIHKVLGNWGWTIIALTVLIKLLFFPLSAASYRSMAKMKTVTPKLTALRERYKSDPTKMNQAMMELYKTEKINPLGGCLPIAVQIPVFISLYWVLLASIEMRNAPWIGWIHDLSAPDPWYILPVIMAVSMFIQTRLNPTPPDPMQAKIMLFMPIIFSVLFFFFPAGLVLYWVVNNILSIAQQWVITKKIEAGKPA
jgi:YidC/Oxa1 family membrane protein insertase